MKILTEKDFNHLDLRMVRSIFRKIDKYIGFTLLDIYYSPSNNASSKNSYHHKIKVLCPNNHESDVIAYYFKGKCVECAGKAKKDNSSFESLLDVEYQLRSDYINNSTHVVLKHLVCNQEYKVRPNDYISKNNRCPFCNTSKTKQYIKDPEDLMNEDNYIDKIESNFKCKVLGKDGNNILIKKDGKILTINFDKNIKKCNILTYQPPISTIQFKEILKAEGYEFIDTYDDLYLKNDKVKYDVLHTECGYKYPVSYNKFTSLNRRCPHCSKVRKYSLAEKEILEYIESLGIACIPNHRMEIDGYRKELDIFIPDLNLGIEYNGAYWHSEERSKSKLNLYEKTQLFKSKDIHIIHIMSDEWSNKRRIVKSRLANIIGKSLHKVYARKCSIVELSSKESFDFMKNNHIQGGNKGEIYAIGLIHNDQLVSVMTFNKPRMTTNSKIKNSDSIELSRFSNLLNHSIVGGFSKLLKYAKHYFNNLGYSSIYSYADARWSFYDVNYALNVYEVNGFTYESFSKPSYAYYRNDDNSYNRSNFMKNKLPNELGSLFDNSLTEYENMKKANYYRVWNCGNYKYRLSL